jgi:hypothetical protein
MRKHLHEIAQFSQGFLLVAIIPKHNSRQNLTTVIGLRINLDDIRMLITLQLHKRQIMLLLYTLHPKIQLGVRIFHAILHWHTLRTTHKCSCNHRIAWTETVLSELIHQYSFFCD